MVIYPESYQDARSAKHKTHTDILIFNLFVTTFLFACSCNGLENSDITLMFSPVDVGL